ncbi:hypothetical protein [Tistrella mobilis]|uniref:hypothetical protein n=1 Tax=Tistrella mobilis TaxID=171437 RepID=UPI0035569A99
MKGKWRITNMPDYEEDYPDMVEPAYILSDGKGAGEFVFGCVTGGIYGAGDETATEVDFMWDGNDEMDPANGGGSATLKPDATLTGQIRFQRGDEAVFIERPWNTSSTAC